MKFSPPLESAIFLKRYKRFFADMQLPEGKIETAHCPNTGSMRNCLVEGSTCYFSRSDNPKRKLKTTLEYITTTNNKLACINTHRANQIVGEALREGRIKELAHYPQIASEVKYGEENSRIDFKLSGDELRDCYLEVKSVTLAEGTTAYFPDAVTTRGQKHLRELISMVGLGHRAILLFCVQHQDIERMTIASQVDPAYADLIEEARIKGVEIMAFGVKLCCDEIYLKEAIPFSNR